MAGDIIYRVLRCTSEFHRKYGVQPTVVYLGHNEYVQLRMLCTFDCGYPYGTTDAGHFQFDGMLVLEVMRNNHIGVSGE